jgi:hypothetical protein
VAKFHHPPKMIIKGSAPSLLSGKGQKTSPLFFSQAGGLEEASLLAEI